ncbi:hypothetical protein BaRGS_00003152 [Batillaria attramentaria]|uniref:Uncharacterized protein n=1 Tax=Batillaria attramentaria TaxID=370345 RepID=A0ABD0M2G9_9CAEN
MPRTCRSHVPKAPNACATIMQTKSEISPPFSSGLALPEGATASGHMFSGKSGNRARLWQVRSIVTCEANLRLVEVIAFMHRKWMQESV